MKCSTPPPSIAQVDTPPAPSLAHAATVIAALAGYNIVGAKLFKLASGHSFQLQLQKMMAGSAWGSWLHKVELGCAQIHRASEGMHSSTLQWPHQRPSGSALGLRSPMVCRKDDGAGSCWHRCNLLLKSLLFRCCPRTCSPTLLQSWLHAPNSGSISGLLNQNLYFNKICRWLVWKKKKKNQEALETRDLIPLTNKFQRKQKRERERNSWIEWDVWNMPIKLSKQSSWGSRSVSANCKYLNTDRVLDAKELLLILGCDNAAGLMLKTSSPRNTEMLTENIVGCLEQPSRESSVKHIAWGWITEIPGTEQLAVSV